MSTSLSACNCRIGSGLVSSGWLCQYMIWQQISVKGVAVSLVVGYAAANSNLMDAVKAGILHIAYILHAMPCTLFTCLLHSVEAHSKGRAVGWDLGSTHNCAVTQQAYVRGAGGPLLQILVERADVSHYKKALEGPFFAVTLRDGNGDLVENELATPPGHYDREHGHINADHAVTFSTPISELPEGRGWCDSSFASSCLSRIQDSPSPHCNHHKHGCRWYEGGSAGVRNCSDSLSCHQCLHIHAWGLHLGGCNPLQLLLCNCPLCCHIVHLSVCTICPHAGTAVYFEVRHYKTAERRLSTLAWSFIPVEVFILHHHQATGGPGSPRRSGPKIRTGPMFLSLYHKPTDTGAHARTQLHHGSGITRKGPRPVSKNHDLFISVLVA